MTGIDPAVEYLLVKLGAKMALGLSIMYGSLWLYNKLNGQSIAEVLETINKDPRAAADYYGRRLLAVGMVILGVLLGG